MSDIRQTLNQVLAGSAPPTEFLKAVDEYLAQPDARIDALKSLIDAAEHLGLPADIAAEARARIPEGDVTPIGEPTRVTDGDSTQIISPDSTRADIGEPTRVTEEGDNERTQLTSGPAPTVLRADPADIDPDRTVASGGDDDRTVVTGDIHRVAGGDPDRTEVTGGGDDDRTVEAGGADPFAMVGGQASNEPGPGSVLKGRFRLEEVIGQGGMGAVYKAVDLLKVEARDRNPYMAVKLLVGDFKEHPEAFIALQRESAKAQRLAHPNIATVYDFDRDGETVYMTMELMVGAELAKYIKKLPAGGLPVPEANKIIEQLCAGLQYAHARGLVHSDFKPGNAFLLDDGTVKLLDFGIARASKTKGDAEGESTVFDPGQLGALTPAYATIEMFEGQDPDPRDDIYALAAVSYELYTGKHPFNKMSAVKAKEKNLKVAPVAKLNKRQNKTLLKALALHRDDRLGSVEEFWEGLKPRKDYTLQIAGGSIAAILLIGFLAYGPIMSAIHDREHDAIVAEIDSGDEARLVAGLEQVDALPDARRRTVAERAQERIVAHFSDRADAAANRAEERYDYPAALAEVDALGRYFPGSGAVLLLRQEFEGERNTLVSELRGRFEELLAAGAVLPVEEEEDITDVLAILKVAQPDIELLDDIRLMGQYVTRADAQVRQQRWQEANRIVGIGLEFAPRHPELLDRRDRIAAELQREQEASMVATLREQLRGTQPRSLADFRAIREPLEQLGELRPADQVVRAFDAPLRRALDSELAELAGAGNWAGADAVLAEFARTLDIGTLISMRTELSVQQRTAGYDVSGNAERNADIARRAAEIRTLLTGAAFDDAFERALTAQFKDFTARASIQNGEWSAVRDEITGAYIAHARALAADNRYVVARTALEAGQRFHPGLE
ncbi:MAG: serine/threonine protein kinase, partial [Xanthomonadaceae bacterium]|nr:serine/threonine protein kinase [Xanthomonadaceae bacterium]